MKIHLIKKRMQKAGRARKGSIALEALVTFSVTMVILMVILGTLVSVVASDVSDWKAMKTLESASSVFNVLPISPHISYVSVAATVNLKFDDELRKAGLTTMPFPVTVVMDDYDYFCIRFPYRFRLIGAAEEDFVILPAGGFQVSDGVDFAEETVYITRTGEKYHEDGCHHLRKSKFGIDREEAIRKGYTPCKNCH